MQKQLANSGIWRHIGLSVALSLLLFGAYEVSSEQMVWAQQPSPTFDITQVTVPLASPIANSGHAIFQQNCAPCHGTTGMGDGPAAKDLPSPAFKFADADAMFERSPAQLFHTAKFGRLEKLMPPWKDQLSDEQIWQAIAYAWTLHTDQTYVDGGKDLYTVSCASCHGVGGAGDGENATSNMASFTDLAFAVGKSQSDWLQGWMSAHPEIGAEWSLDDQRMVLEYIRTFSYVPPWQSPYRPGSGTIAGQAIQRTDGGSPVEGLDVTLEAFVDFQRVAAFTTTVDAAGQFRFDTLAVDPNVIYMASVASEGVSYSSPILTLAPQTTTLTTTISIFGQTDQPDAIMIDRAHWILDSQPGGLIVGQIFEFSNTGDRTYVGSQVDGIDAPVTIALPVPPGVQEINFENGALGERFQQKGDLIYDTTPVVPGKAARQIVMRYVVPNDGALDLNLQYQYPIGDLTLLVSELPGVEAEVSELTSIGSQSLQGSSYLLWQGQALQPGAISVSLSGLLTRDSIDPRTTSGDDSTTNTAVATTNVPQLESWASWLMGGLILVPLAGVLAWSIRNGRVRQSGRGAELRARRNELIAQIARLDDLHSLDQLDNAAWQEQRSLLKAELLEINARIH